MHDSLSLTFLMHTEKFTSMAIHISKSFPIKPTYYSTHHIHHLPSILKLHKLIFFLSWASWNFYKKSVMIHLPNIITWNKHLPLHVSTSSISDTHIASNCLYTGRWQLPEDSTTSSVNMSSGRPSTSAVASNGVISEIWLISPCGNFFFYFYLNWFFTLHITLK